MILANLGCTVTAVSGKPDRAEWLRELGASRVIAREEVLSESKRPLLKAHWAGAIDTVGGAMLASLLRSVKHEGCVAACGVVGGGDLHTSVYPFILRGVTLRGIDSAWCPIDRRREIWEKLAADWKPESLSSIQEMLGLEQLSDKVQQLLAGENTGRTIVDVQR
jgi:putative YhdH/YhfP family quinone oxidoreductase